MQVRTIINSRDRLSPLQKLIEWLWEAGQHEIVVLDSLSTYPPLLDYYRQIERRGVRVVRLRSNMGPHALWKQPNKALLRPPFVLSDSDCVPAEECPLDLIDFLWRAGNEIKGRYRALWHHPDPLQKIGPSFNLSNIPDSYKLKPWVLEWENHIGGHGEGRERFEGVDIYDAAIDTTFALYLDSTYWGYSAARVGAPFLVDHLGWHVDSKKPTDEEVYYEQHAIKGQRFHNWGSSACHSKQVQSFCRQIKL